MPPFQEEGPEASFGERLQAVRDPKHFESLVASTDKLVVDFYAPWCGKCRMIAPFVEQLMDKRSDVTFVKFGACVGSACRRALPDTLFPHQTQRRSSSIPCQRSLGSRGSQRSSFTRHVRPALFAYVGSTYHHRLARRLEARS